MEYVGTDKVREKWTACEILIVQGIEIRVFSSGVTALYGKAFVAFSNGERTIKATYNVEITYSEGMVASLMGSTGTYTEYFMYFDIDATDQEILSSFEETFQSETITIGVPLIPVQGVLGWTFTLNPITNLPEYDKWKSDEVFGTGGISYGPGLTGACSIQIAKYTLEPN